MNSNVIDASTDRPGVLTIWITAQGLSFTGVQNFISSFAVSDLSGSITNVTETTYFSPTNAIYGGQLLNSVAFSGIGTMGPVSTPRATSGTYSVSEQYVIFDVGGTAGNDNLTIDLAASAVPEPASLGLIGAGLLGIFASKFRR